MKGPAVEGRGSSKRLGIARLKHSARDTPPLRDPAELKQLVDLRNWLNEHHAPVNQQGFTRCPNERTHRAGSDEPPHENCHVYDDHVHCFACGYHADIYRLAVDLATVRTVPGKPAFASALEYVGWLAGQEPPSMSRRRNGSRRMVRPDDIARPCCRKPVTDDEASRFLATVGAQLGQPLPRALQGRGFRPDDRSTLGFVGGTSQKTAGDGLFPVLDPEGLIVTVRRRLAQPVKGAKYLPAPGFTGDESPAWCSPCITCGPLFIVEGELNAMACWLALDGQAAVMGVSGTSGSLWYEPIGGRTVFVLPDAGQPGESAARRWARTAHHAGARTVHVVPAWQDGDACHVAGTHGPAELKGRLS